MTISDADIAWSLGRSCDRCTLCCLILDVDLRPMLPIKPRGKYCTHCKPDVGCKIYSTPRKPAICSEYFCVYLFIDALSEIWHPKKCGMIVQSTTNLNGSPLIEVHVADKDNELWSAEP